MRPAIVTDTLRTISSSKRRFAAIAAICVLGVTMLVGLTIACQDLRLSADEFYDAQRLYDVSVQSTLGLSSSDVEALGALDGVDEAQGAYSETAYTEVDGALASVDVRSFAKDGMNVPYLVEGRLPSSSDEVAVTAEYLEATGKRIGDALTFGTSADEGSWAANDEQEHQEKKAQELLDKIDDGDDIELTDDERELLADLTAADVARAAVKDGLDLEHYGTLTDEQVTDLLTDAYEGRFDDLGDSTDNGESTELFARHTYTIVASVIDPMSVAAKNGSSSFRATGAKYGFFVTDEAATSSAYTAVYLRVSGADELSCFSDEYQALVDRVTSEAEGIKSQREAAREQEIADDGNAQIDDAEKSANDQFQKVDDRLAEAQKTIDDAVAQIESGRAELSSQKASALDQLASAQAQINDGRNQLVAAQAELDSQKQQAQEGVAAYDQGQAQVDAGVAQYKDGITQINQAIAAFGLPGADAYALSWPQEQWDAVAAATDEAGSDEACTAFVGAVQSQADALKGYLDSMAAFVPEAYKEQFDQLVAQIGALPSGAQELAGGQAQLSLSKAQVETARAALAAGGAIEQAQAQIDAGYAQLEQGQAELVSARAQLEAKLAEAEAQLADAQSQVDEGQAELDENREEYERQKAEALQKIADARAKLADIGTATWYVQTRSAISSFSSIDSDASSIEVIGTVFPAIFLTVAILMSLTTAARMVEEQRELIGLYKALGYPKRSIMAKYVAYTAAAALVGCAVGSLLGFVALPEFLFQVFAVMYVFPAFTLHFDAGLCALAAGMFVIGIGGASALTVRGELSEQPAQLMRPRAPKAGKRILLERIRPIWSHLGFLNKVTARNLFRYKKRLAMTIFGVAGCTALMIAGFAIHDTVLALCPNQYGDDTREGVTCYDLLAVTQPDDLEAAAQRLTSDPEVQGYTSLRTENVTLEHNGKKETVQLVVVPDGFTLDGYINLRTESGETLSLADATAGGTVLATKSASTVLGFGAGDEVSLQDTTLSTANATVSDVVMSYLGDCVYMTQDTYESLFGKELEANALAVNLTGDADAQIAYKDKLANNTTFLSVTSTQEGIRDFSTNFMLINYVIVLITGLAAGLSFVVLFTLSTTNVSERERELATIKVLGFRKREVRTYINKEMLILAVIGTVVGIPLGTLLGHALTYVLNMPSMYFAVEIAPVSYVYSCVLSLVFALVVTIICRPTIDRIDMVAALKSAE